MTTQPGLDEMEIRSSYASQLFYNGHSQTDIRGACGEFLVPRTWFSRVYEGFFNGARQGLDMPRMIKIKNAAIKMSFKNQLIEQAIRYELVAKKLREAAEILSPSKVHNP